LARHSQAAQVRDVHPIRLLEADPDLGAALDQEAFDAARERALAAAIQLDRGVWAPGDARVDHMLGLFVVSGVLMRSESLSVRPGAELVGAGDFVRPRLPDGDSWSVRSQTSWLVVEPSVLACLDRGLPARVGRWPEILAALFDRAVERARMVAFQTALTQIRRIDRRVLVLLWRFADRWGRVHPDGVVLPFRLTHEALGRLVGAQRPTVTTAVQRLSADGSLLRLSTGGWLLRGAPPSFYDENEAHELVLQRSA
jgi:CRP/FNR family transcriptional regulator, cyclic AMP receptor protein